MTSAMDHLLEWDFLEAVVTYFGNGMGIDAFFFVFLGATFFALYQSTGSVMLPVVVVIVLAPMIAALLPAVGIQFLTITLLSMTAIGGYWLFLSLDI